MTDDAAEATPAASPMGAFVRSSPRRAATVSGNTVSSAAVSSSPSLRNVAAPLMSVTRTIGRGRYNTPPSAMAGRVSTTRRYGNNRLMKALFSDILDRRALGVVAHRLDLVPNAAHVFITGEDGGI